MPVAPSQSRTAVPVSVLRCRLQQEKGPAPGAILERLLLRAVEERCQCCSTMWSTAELR